MKKSDDAINQDGGLLQSPYLGDSSLFCWVCSIIVDKVYTVLVTAKLYQFSITICSWRSEYVMLLIACKLRLLESVFFSYICRKVTVFLQAAINTDISEIFIFIFYFFSILESLSICNSCVMFYMDMQIQKVYLKGLDSCICSSHLQGGIQLCTF